MDQLEKGIREIASEMKLILGDKFSEDDYYQLVHSTYVSMRERYAEDMELMKPEAIIQVLRQQIGELVRMRRAPKLLAKRQNVSPPTSEK